MKKVLDIKYLKSLCSSLVIPWKQSKRLHISFSLSHLMVFKNQYHSKKPLNSACQSSSAENPVAGPEGLRRFIPTPLYFIFMGKFKKNELKSANRIPPPIHLNPLSRNPGSAPVTFSKQFGPEIRPNKMSDLDLDPNCLSL